MSSETDQPRQRTVAELLAQHGADSGSAGRRRRRRETDEAVDDAGAPVSSNGAGGAGPSTAWPPARSPMPERSTPQPPASLAGPAGGGRPEPGRPAAGPQHQPGGYPANGAPVNGGPQSTQAHNAQPPNTQWGPPARREPDRPPDPGYRPDGYTAEPVDPRRDRMPTGGWGAQPPQPQQPQPRPDTASWDRRPADQESSSGRWNRPTGPRPEPGPPPRAFAPGPEPTRGAPPHAQNPHVGQAAPPSSAQFGGPPRPGFDQPTGMNPAPFGRPGPGGAVDPGLTGPIDQQRMQALSEATSRVQRRDPADSGPATAVGLPPAGADDRHRNRVGQGRPDDGGPATAVGLPPAGAEDWHRSRVGQGRPDDGGPATAVGLPPAGAEDWHRSRVGGGAPAGDGGPATEAAAPMDFDEFDGHPAGLGPTSGSFNAVGDEVGPDGDEAAEGGGQSWAPVLAQWIIGAIGGAALWVGFRYLWSSLLVVAIAAAILVTAGLVIAVRTLLRNTDLRTSIAAGLVGILLTASPAVLVLLGR
jgi:hypothetical protein